MRDARPTLCIDFDDVIHSYDGPWGPGHSVGYIPGDLLEGAKEALTVLRDDYEIVIFSCRAENDKGRRAIDKWLRGHGILVDHITAKKVPAVVYLDDRALQFTGDWWQTLQQLREFKTWKETEQ